MRWLESITDAMDVNLSRLWEILLRPPVTFHHFVCSLLFLNEDFIILLFTVCDAGAITVRSVERLQ